MVGRLLEIFTPQAVCMRFSFDRLGLASYQNPAIATKQAIVTCTDIKVQCEAPLQPAALCSLLHAQHLHSAKAPAAIAGAFKSP